MWCFPTSETSPAAIWASWRCSHVVQAARSVHARRVLTRPSTKDCGCTGEAECRLTPEHNSVVEREAIFCGIPADMNALTFGQRLFVRGVAVIRAQAHHQLGLALPLARFRAGQLAAGCLARVEHLGV